MKQKRLGHNRRDHLNEKYRNCWRYFFFVRRLPQSLVEFNGNSVAAQLPDFLVVFKREEKSKKDAKKEAFIDFFAQ